MNAKVFINYRREDTAPYAGRLYDRLTEHFGEDRVFIDIDQIEPGEDFVEAINRKVATCDIAIVAIGPNWLRATDASGKRRLDDEEDFVRMGNRRRAPAQNPRYSSPRRRSTDAGETRSSRSTRTAVAKERDRAERNTSF